MQTPLYIVIASLFVTFQPLLPLYNRTTFAVLHSVDALVLFIHLLHKCTKLCYKFFYISLSFQLLSHPPLLAFLDSNNLLLTSPIHEIFASSLTLNCHSEYSHLLVQYRSQFHRIFHFNQLFSFYSHYSKRFSLTLNSCTWLASSITPCFSYFLLYFATGKQSFNVQPYGKHLFLLYHYNRFISSTGEKLQANT